MKVKFINTGATVTFTSCTISIAPITTSIATTTTCKSKGLKMKIS